MTLLNDNYILKNLKEQNEWWSSGIISSDLTPAFRRKEYERVENVFFNSIRRFPVLSGPRRVGKSTIAFQIIDKLLKDGIKPERILFYTLDEFPNDGIAIKDTDGIVVLGMPNIPGYVITKNNDDYGLSERKNTTLYRIPIVVFLYLIGKNKK